MVISMVFALRMVFLLQIKQGWINTKGGPDCKSMPQRKIGSQLPLILKTFAAANAYWTAVFVLMLFLKMK